MVRKKILTYPQSAVADHLGEDAADGPHVNSERVLLGTKQDFRSTVPQSDHFMSVGLDRHGKGTGESKVSNLEVALHVNKNVSGLQVAVDDTPAVAVVDATKQLHGVRGNEILVVRAVAGGVEVLLQILVDEFERKVQAVFAMLDVAQPDHIGVAQGLEDGDLAKRSAGNALVFEFELDFFQSNDFSRDLVLGFVDDAIGAFSKSFRAHEARKAAHVGFGCCSVSW